MRSEAQVAWTESLKLYASMMFISFSISRRAIKVRRLSGS